MIDAERFASTLQPRDNLAGCRGALAGIIIGLGLWSILVAALMAACWP